MNCDNHTPRPDSYIEWHKWARKMELTHKQTKCPECKLWKIWIVKPTLNGRRCATASEKLRRKKEILEFNYN